MNTSYKHVISSRTKHSNCLTFYFNRLCLLVEAFFLLDLRLLGQNMRQNMRSWEWEANILLVGN